MGEEELESFEADMEMQLFREYRDVLPMFSYVVETERRFYLANQVEVTPHDDGGGAWFEVVLADAWVWDMYRPARFVSSVKVLSRRDVNVEELRKDDVLASDAAKSPPEGFPTVP
jgi:hypothetical protein